MSKIKAFNLYLEKKCLVFSRDVVGKLVMTWKVFSMLTFSIETLNSSFLLSNINKQFWAVLSVHKLIIEMIITL